MAINSGKYKHLIGRKINSWTILTTPERLRNSAVCRCDCGGIRKIELNSVLREGPSASKGCRPCLARRSFTTHGLSRKNKRLYGIWQGMKARCDRPSNGSYRRYHSKGISVCDEWSASFVAFYAWATSNGYSDGLTIDRIDNSHGYAPGNCRWATYAQQGNNRTNNFTIKAFGASRTSTEWARQPECSVNALTLRRRILSGWPPEEAIRRAPRKC